MMSTPQREGMLAWTSRGSWEDRMTDRLRALVSGRAGFAALAATVPLLVGACNQVGGQTLTFWDIFWSMVWFFFLFMAIWIWIQVLSDIFRRDDMTGGVKAIWIFVVIFLPFLGCLIYIAMRPKVTAQDVQMMTRAEAAMGAAAQVSTADELTKLAQLRDSGAISAAEFESLKAKLVS
jgi:hypothetical protein